MYYRFPELPANVALGISIGNESFSVFPAPSQGFVETAAPKPAGSPFEFDFHSATVTNATGLDVAAHRVRMVHTTEVMGQEEFNWWDAAHTFTDGTQEFWFFKRIPGPTGPTSMLGGQWKASDFALSVDLTIVYSGGGPNRGSVPLDPVGNHCL